MILRGIDFGHVFCASGSRNFFGDGYWFFPYGKHLGLDYTGSTFIAKTMTLEPRAGNMPLQEHSTAPLERRPKCIIVKPIDGAVLHAVNYSNPGAKWLFEQHLWQKRTDPFFLSFAALSPHDKDRSDEIKGFADLLGKHLASFQTSIGLQIVLPCPSPDMDMNRLAEEACAALDVFSALRIPLVIKCNILIHWDAVKKIGSHHACDAVCCSNGIPWGKLPHRIFWKDLFGQSFSPLQHMGGGELSGRPLFRLILEWIHGVRLSGYHKPVLAGGGILSRSDADKIFEAGATAIELGSISLLRPWRIQPIIRHVNTTIRSRHLQHGLGLDTGSFRREPRISYK